MPRTTDAGTSPDTLAGVDAGHEELRIRFHLREALRKRALTQRELERRLGLPRGRVSRLLGGQTHLSLRQALELLAAADLSAEEFFAEVYGLARPEPPRAPEALGGIPMERWLEEFEQLRRRLAQAGPEPAAGAVSSGTGGPPASARR